MEVQRWATGRWVWSGAVGPQRSQAKLSDAGGDWPPACPRGTNAQLHSVGNRSPLVGREDKDAEEARVLLDDEDLDKEMVGCLNKRSHRYYRR